MEYAYKNRIILFFCVIVVIYVGYWLMRPISSTKTLRIHGKQYSLHVADTPKEWEQGLMNVRVLPSFDGMVFEFPDRQYRTFWNKNTYMDLDLYWMNDDVVVGKSVLPSIEHSSLTIIRSPQGVNRVVEIPRK